MIGIRGHVANAQDCAVSRLILPYICEAVHNHVTHNHVTIFILGIRIHTIFPQFVCRNKYTYARGHGP